MGGSNDSDVDLNGGVGAHRKKFTIGEDSKQARLKLSRHIADFIKKQSAAISLLKSSGPARLSASEGPSLVPKEL